MDVQRRSSTTTALDRLFVDFQSVVAGRYSIERELGRGGMGVVYLAREVRLDRPVALKLLPPVLAAQPGPRERFLREARLAAKLSHPNIIPIHAVDEVADYVFFAMAYVEGETLTERVRNRGPLPPGDATRLLREVAWALAYAHAQGVIHRDVKPDNIMLEAGSGRALVADFGIAAQVSGAAGVDGGDVIGTPEFMSPEQALGEKVDAKSDLYSLGIVGYFILTGRLPFTGKKPTEVLAKQVTEAARPVTTVADGTPRRLAQTIDKCLAKEKDERPESAATLAEQMSLALEQRKELPVPLRVFAKRGGRFRDLSAFLYLGGITTLSGFAAATASQAGLGFFAWAGTWLVGLTVVPFALLVARAARIANNGFTRDDVVTAFRSELESGSEERAYEYGRGPSHYERVMRWMSVAGVSVAGVGALLATSAALAPVAGIAALLGLMVGLPAGGLALARLQRRRDLDTEIWMRIWRGPIGRLIFGRLPRTDARPALSSGFTFRPTELVLGMAAERLFEELPKETREELRELPDVLRRLEQDAGRMRVRLEELNDALQGAEERGRLSGQIAGDIKEKRDRVVNDLENERELVQRRLKDAVAALETIRLNLLKLHAGAGSVQSLTTDLTLAREAAQEVELLLQAHKEIEDAL
ncbi:MAG TPA: protein kinase [Gemmatimonadales bacterium]|nr:protein kinase [Gemmatimonadales bacterium]